MIRDDFRHMYCGRQLDAVSDEMIDLMQPVRITGKGKNRALLMLHGFTSSPAVYRDLIPHIKHYDAIICPVLPGHADSIARFSKITASDWLTAANAACEEVMREYKRVDVLGLSLGGLLACALSQHHQFNHMYLLAPALRLRLHMTTSLKLAKTLHFLGFRQIRNAAGNIVNPEHTEISYRRLPIETVIEILSFINDFHYMPPSCPVDVFLGCHDIVVNSQRVGALFARKDHTTIHWLKNSAHVLPLDNDIQEIIDCMNKNA